jgi:hypothetical protein
MMNGMMRREASTFFASVPSGRVNSIARPFQYFS